MQKTCPRCMYFRQLEETDKYHDFIEQYDIVGKCYQFYQDKIKHHIERINLLHGCSNFRSGDNNELKEEMENDTQ